MPSSPINALNLYRRFVEPTEQPIEERGSILPIGEYEDGSVGFAWPELLMAPYEGLRNFGRYGYDTPEAVADNARNALDVAGLATTGALGARLAAKPGISELFDVSSGSKNARIFDPPNKPQRAFDEDYPDVTGRHDAEGRLTHDIEGNPLTARYVVGRQVVGGAEEALSPAEFDALTEALTGRSATFAPASKMGRDAGRTILNKYTGEPLDVYLRNNLSEAQEPRVYAHEIGHVIDALAAGTDGIPQASILQNELKPVYNTLNNPNRSRDGAEAATWGKSARPEDFGYKGADIPPEYMAEAIRAYLQDPNYLKTVARDTAERIREYVNTNPRLNKVIQFNANAPTGAVGPLAMEAQPDDTDIEPALLEYLRLIGLD